jgi:beta-glucosidase
MSIPGLTYPLISALLAANPNTALVLQSGTPTHLSPFLPDCTSILQAWYGGNETGNAIADVLFGDVNPSGKLPLTFPMKMEDNPAYLNHRSENGRVLYGEGVFIGYRYYEKTGREVAFPFGHGLSYTTFEMSNLAVSDETKKKGKKSGDELEDEVVVNVDVQNTGKRAGMEVVQVYIVPPECHAVNRPVKELKGFSKVHLLPGEKKTVQVVLSKKYAASFWDERAEAWCMESGVYEIQVGPSSAEIQVKGRGFEVKGTRWWNGL